MKTLTFLVTIEGLPDHAKDYRVQGDVCAGATELLRKGYSDGQVNVIVAPTTVSGPVADVTDAGTQKMQAYVKGLQKRWEKARAA